MWTYRKNSSSNSWPERRSGQTLTVLPDAPGHSRTRLLANIARGIWCLTFFILCAIHVHALAATTTGNSTTGQTLFASNCASCHGDTPNELYSAPLNAANAGDLIDYARTKGMGAPVLTSTQYADIAAYIALFAPAHNPVNEPIAYNSPGTSIAIPNIELGSTYIKFTNLVLDSGPSKGSVNFSGTTATYKPTSGQYGADSFTFHAVNADGKTSNVRTVSVLIANPPAPSVTSAGTASSGVQGAAYSGYQITASNNPTSFGASGLPPGLSVNASGLISGTPTTAGNYTALVSASNVGGTGTKSVSFAIKHPPPQINSSLSANGSTGVAFSYSITATNSPTSFNATGLPPGLSINTSSGVISGTPTTSGTYNTTISATNDNTTDTETLVISIALSAPQINSALSTNGATGVAFSYTITATNSPTSFNASNLPPGLSINTGTGVISGTPTANGSYNATISATNATGTDSDTLAIEISLSAPVITSSLSKSGATGIAFSYSITATNSPTSFNATNLPPGLSIDPATGVISGTPTTSGTFNSGISASNASATDNKTLVISIALSAPNITSPFTKSGATAVAFSYTITASNSPTSFNASNLPPGLSINGSTGEISGTPTTAGTFNASISATNATATDTDTLVITIALSPPVITSANTASGTSGQPFSYFITASSSPSSYGATGLPAGLTVNASTGEISGTFAGGGTSNATISATNASGTGSQVLTITAAYVPPSTNGISATTAFNTAVSINLPITGQFSQVVIVTPPAHGNVPAPATGVSSVTFTPAAGYTGSDSFTYKATGQGGAGDSPNATVTISVSDLQIAQANITVPLNTATTIDLAPYINAPGITGVSILTSPAHGTAVANGTSVTFTPANNFSGKDAFTYAVYGSNSQTPSATANVNLNIGAGERPNPVKDAVVTAMVASQVETARRFSQAQVSNFQTRMESLHRSREGSAPAASNVASSSFGARPYVGGIGALASNRNVRSNMPSSPANRTVGAAAYRPAASLSSDPYGSSMPSGQAASGDALTAVLSSMSAGPDGAQASDGLATVGKALGFAASAMRDKSFNLSVSSDDKGGNSSSANDTNVWIGGGVRFGTRDKNSSDRVKFSTDGISFGVDRRFSDDLVLGAGFGYAKDESSIGTDGSNSASTGYTLAAYGSYQPAENIYLDGILGYGRLRYDTERYIEPVDSFASSQRSGDYLFASLTAAYEHRANGLLLSPYGRLDLVEHRLDAATEEHGGPYSLHYYRQKIPGVSFAAGFRAETAHETGFGWVTPRMRVELKHDFKGEQEASVSYADQIGGTKYTIAPNDNERDSIVLGIGSDFIYRNGLTLSVDYQMERVPGEDNIQALNLKLTKNLDGRNAAPGLLATSLLGRDALGLKVDAGVLYDSNVSRSSLVEERLSDRSISLNLSKTALIPVGEFTRMFIHGFAGGEQFKVYDGLNKIYLGGQAELQYRSSGDFGTPIYSVFVNGTAENYESSLRDGHRYSVGLSLRKAMTDRIELFGALANNVRYGRSAVFDTKDYSARMNLDFSLDAGRSIYVGSEYRRGDITSSGSPSLANIDTAELLVADDVFDDEGYSTYRFDGSTVMLTLGYSLPLGAKDTLDLSWRQIRSRASEAPDFSGAGVNRYTSNQFSILYLTSF